MQRDTLTTACVIAMALGAAGACSETPASLAPADAPHTSMIANQPPPPAGIVTARFGPSVLELWPYTGTDLAGSDADPMNVLFLGQVDVLSLRAALMRLDGDRTAFGLPSTPPFDCVWTDAFGDVQSAWSSGAGWVANPVQLACGPYDPLRFHLRLFPAGPWVMGGAHFELRVPGTADHRVISWELPEQLLQIDLLRTGLLHSEMPYGRVGIGPAPSYKTIEAEIYNGIPDALKVLVNLPPGPASAPVPVPTDGDAIVFRLKARAPLDRGTTTQSFTITYDQFVPRPFCSGGPADVLYVRGPVNFEQRVTTNGEGMLNSWQRAHGRLIATPIDPRTGVPTGPTFEADVSDLHKAMIQRGAWDVASVVQRRALPPAADQMQTLIVRLMVGSTSAVYTRKEQC